MGRPQHSGLGVIDNLFLLVALGLVCVDIAMDITRLRGADV